MQFRNFITAYNSILELSDTHMKDIVFPNNDSDSSFITLTSSKLDISNTIISNVTYQENNGKYGFLILCTSSSAITLSHSKLDNFSA